MTSATRFFLLITASRIVTFCFCFEHKFSKFTLLYTAPLGKQSASLYIFPIHKIEFFVIKLLFISPSENKDCKQHFRKRNPLSYHLDCMRLTGQSNNFESTVIINFHKGDIIGGYTNIYFWEISFSFTAIC